MENTTAPVLEKVDKGEECLVRATFGAGKVCALLLVLSVLAVVGAVLALPHVRFMYFALICAVGFAIATIGLFVGNGVGKESIEVSRKIIHGTTIFGSDMYLPTDEISAVGVTAFGGVVVTTANYKLRCYFVKNRREILDEILKIINK